MNDPTRDTWVSARTIVVAPQMSAMGQTLWQCVEAVTLTRYPDGPATAHAALGFGRRRYHGQTRDHDCAPQCEPHHAGAPALKVGQ